MQILLVHPPEDTQEGAERRPCLFAGITVDLTSATAIIIPRPFAHTVVDCRMGRIAATIAWPLVSMEPRAACRHVCGNELATGPCVRMITHPKTVLAPRQERVIAIAGSTAVGWVMPLCTEQAPFGAVAAGACESVRVQVALHPYQADAIIQEVAYRKVNQTSMLPHSAR